MLHTIRTMLAALVATIVTLGGAHAPAGPAPERAAAESPCIVDVEGAQVTTRGVCPGAIRLTFGFQRLGLERVERTLVTTLGGEGACSITYRNRLSDRTAIIEWVHSAAMLESVWSDCPAGVRVRFHDELPGVWENDPEVLVDVIGTDDDDFAPGADG